MNLYDKVAGVALLDIVFPIIAWTFIISYYVYQFHRRSQYRNIAFDPSAVNDPNFQYSHNYFYQMRAGWVRRNKLTGQGTANSTRDYLRVLLFFAGNSAVIAFLFVGYLASFYDAKNGSPEARYLSLKLGCCALNFLITFWLFIYSIRYATQFHFLMNVEEVNNGIPMNNIITEKVFHISHFYYAAGLRMYYVALPLFAWFISSWVLLCSVPVFVYIVEEYEDMSALESELEKMYMGTKYAKPGMQPHLDEEDMGQFSTAAGDIEMAKSTPANSSDKDSQKTA